MVCFENQIESFRVVKLKRELLKIFEQESDMMKMVLKEEFLVWLYKVDWSVERLEIVKL